MTFTFHFRANRVSNPFSPLAPLQRICKLEIIPRRRCTGKARGEEGAFYSQRFLPFPSSRFASFRWSSIFSPTPPVFFCCFCGSPLSVYFLSFFPSFLPPRLSSRYSSIIVVPFLPFSIPLFLSPSLPSFNPHSLLAAFFLLHFPLLLLPSLSSSLSPSPPPSLPLLLLLT